MSENFISLTKIAYSNIFFLYQRMRYPINIYELEIHIFF
jgi:hypothetical protein